MRRFTGSHDACGDAVCAEGEVIVETVHRFEGQSAERMILDRPQA